MLTWGLELLLSDEGHTSGSGVPKPVCVASSYYRGQG